MVAGTPVIRTGEQLGFVKVVAVAPAVVRRDGRIQAGGHPAGYARLGVLEQQLDGAEHRDHDYRAVHVGDSGHELRLGSIDGSVTRVPDTPANQEAYFLGAGRVALMLATGTHVLIRVKSDLALPRISGFLPDGSYYSYLAAGPPQAPEGPRRRIRRGLGRPGHRRDVLPDQWTCWITLSTRSASSPPPMPGGGPDPGPP